MVDPRFLSCMFPEEVKGDQKNAIDIFMKLVKRTILEGEENFEQIMEQTVPGMSTISTRQDIGICQSLIQGMLKDTKDYIKMLKERFGFTEYKDVIELDREFERIHDRKSKYYLVANYNLRVGKMMAFADVINKDKFDIDELMEKFKEQGTIGAIDPNNNQIKSHKLNSIEKVNDRAIRVTFLRAKEPSISIDSVQLMTLLFRFIELRELINFLEFYNLKIFEAIKGVCIDPEEVW